MKPRRGKLVAIWILVLFALSMVIYGGICFSRSKIREQAFLKCFQTQKLELKDYDHNPLFTRWAWIERVVAGDVYGTILGDEYKRDNSNEVQLAAHITNSSNLSTVVYTFTYDFKDASYWENHQYFQK